MKINFNTNHYINKFTFKSNNNADEARLIISDGTMKYGADHCLTKKDEKGNTLNEYFKNGKYIVHETISPVKKVNRPFRTKCKEITAFDRLNGEKIIKRRYPEGTEDILTRGSWDSLKGYEIMHLDKEGNVKGYTRREYTETTEDDKQYWGYDFYYLGNIIRKYVQTRFDKDHKPIGSFEGMEILRGKKIRSL